MHGQEKGMKILLWVILIIFLIGLLVVTGVFKMIF
ncbi:protein YohP [Escherichia coli]|nr:protein YohP [Escherichia coli]